MEPAKLTAALDELVRSELVFRYGAPPAAAYIFKHALVGSLADYAGNARNEDVPSILSSR